MAAGVKVGMAAVITAEGDAVVVDVVERRGVEVLGVGRFPVRTAWLDWMRDGAIVGSD